MRTRTKSTLPAPGTDPRKTQILLQDGSVYLEGNFNHISGGSVSTMSDEKPQFAKIGECSHVTVTQDGLESGDGRWIVLGRNKLSTPSPTPWFVSNRAHPRYLMSPAGTQSVPVAHLPVSTLPLTGLAARAAKRLNALTLANSIWETKDFPGMFDLVRRRERIGAALTGHRQSDSRIWRRLFKLSESVRPLKGAKRLIQFGRLLRDENLTWAFGFAPTISDVKKIRKELPRAWANRYRQFRPFSVYINDFSSSSTSGTPFPNTDYSFVQYNTVRRVAGIRCTPPKPKSYYYDQFRAADKLLQDLNGDPLSAIWEAVPWSFVIDWFLSIDDLIADASLRSLSGYDIRPWTSSKQESSITWSCQAYHNIDTFTGAYTERYPEQWTHTRTTFNRAPASLPSLLSNVRFRVGPKQTFLGILLALGLVDRPKSGR